MSSPYTLRAKLSLRLIRLGLRMLPKPYWSSGAIVLSKKSAEGYVGSMFTSAPNTEQVAALQDVSLELCKLLCDTAIAKEPLPARLLWCSNLAINGDPA